MILMWRLYIKRFLSGKWQLMWRRNFSCLMDLGLIVSGKILLLCCSLSIWFQYVKTSILYLRYPFYSMSSCVLISLAAPLLQEYCANLFYREMLWKFFFPPSYRPAEMTPSPSVGRLRATQKLTLDINSSTAILIDLWFTKDKNKSSVSLILNSLSC